MESKPGGFFQAQAYGFDCYQTQVPEIGIYAVPDGGVNSAKISSVDLQHIKLAPAEHFDAPTFGASITRHDTAN